MAACSPRSNGTSRARSPTRLATARSGAPPRRCASSPRSPPRPPSRPRKKPPGKPTPPPRPPRGAGWHEPHLSVAAPAPPTPAPATRTPPSQPPPTPTQGESRAPAAPHAARGIPVYPVHWPRPGWGEPSLACSCARGVLCDRPAKHPLVRHGIHDATCDPIQLERWWSRWPAANLGLATGIVFDALDVDGPAGLAALRQFARAANLRLPGPLVATGGGGWHHWFRPTGLGNRPPHGLAHIDWRGRGGCVLAPPSR